LLQSRSVYFFEFINIGLGDINVQSVVTGSQSLLIVLLTHFEGLDRVKNDNYYQQDGCGCLNDSYWKWLLFLLVNQGLWLTAFVLQEESGLVA
jgi:hypothetical protein